MLLKNTGFRVFHVSLLLYGVPRNSTRSLGWICTIYAGPAQPITTAGEELDDLSVDRSDRS